MTVVIELPDWVFQACMTWLPGGGPTISPTHSSNALKALIPETCWSSGFETFKSKWVMFWESNGDGGRPHLSTSVSSWQPLPLTTKLAPLPLDGEPGQCLRFYCKVDYDQSSMVAMMQSVTNFSNTIQKKRRKSWDGQGDNVCKEGYGGLS